MSLCRGYFRLDDVNFSNFPALGNTPFWDATVITVSRNKKHRRINTVLILKVPITVVADDIRFFFIEISIDILCESSAWCLLGRMMVHMKCQD